MKSSLCLIYKVWCRRGGEIKYWLYVFLISPIAARSEVSCTPPSIFLCTHWVLDCVGSAASQVCVQNCRMYRLPVTDSRSSSVQPVDKSTITGKCELNNREFPPFTVILKHVPCLFDCFCYNQQMHNCTIQYYLLI